MKSMPLQVVGGADKYTALCRHCFRKPYIGATTLNKKSSTDSSTSLNKRYVKAKLYMMSLGSSKSDRSPLHILYIHI